MALRDISLGCRIGSLSEQSGHGPTCCRLNSVGNDPKRTLAPLSASLSALHYARSLRGHMQRRHFITLLGGTAVGWPLAARAQQPERVRRIGVLMSMAADNPEGQARIAAFHQGLQQSGWTVGHNLRIDTRWGAGDADRMRRFAAELVSLAPDVILASGGTAVGALLQATRTVPIVFAQVTDPVGAGFVASLPRPGGNATGFAISEYGISAKWLALLKETAHRDLSVSAGPLIRT
jgi:putative ABC transport system substrate-binding protein